MLAGVGGRTIEEAKASLSYEESQSWFQYVEKRGSLNIGRRLEYGFALLLHVYLQSKGNKRTDIFDFMPHESRPETEVQLEIDDIVRLFGITEAETVTPETDDPEQFLKRTD